MHLRISDIASNDLLTSLFNLISFRFSAEEIKKEENVIVKYNQLAFSLLTHEI